MKKALSVAVAAVSVVSLVASTTVAVSAHGNGNDNNWWGSSRHDDRDRRSYDVRFIDYAVMHHQMGIDMAKVEVEKGAQPELVTFAKNIINDQTEEINTLKELRQKLTGDSSYDTMSKYTDKGHMMNMWGIPDADDIAKSGNVDLAFIDAMTVHHATMLPVANKLLVKSDNMDLKKLVRTMSNTQSAEIGKLAEYRAAWFPDAIESPYAKELK